MHRIIMFYLVIILFGALGIGTAGSAAAASNTVPACQIDSPPADCQNLWALQVDMNVPHGAYVFVPDPGCMNDSAGALNNVIQAAVVAGVPELALFSGSISDMATPLVAGELAKHGGFISEHLSAYAKNGAMCAPVVGVVPVKAVVEGFRLSAGDDHGWAGCQAGSDCGIGWSKYQAEPVVQGSAGMQTVMSMFMNWSHDRDRVARMIVFYRLPAGQKPLKSM